MEIFLGVVGFILHFVGASLLIFLNGFIKNFIKSFEEKKNVYIILNMLLFFFSIPIIFFVICTPFFVYLEYPFFRINEKYVPFLLLYGSLIGVFIIESSHYKAFDKKMKNKLKL